MPDQDIRLNVDLENAIVRMDGDDLLLEIDPTTAVRLVDFGSHDPAPRVTLPDGQDIDGNVMVELMAANGNLEDDEAIETAAGGPAALSGGVSVYEDDFGASPPLLDSEDTIEEVAGFPGETPPNFEEIDEEEFNLFEEEVPGEEDEDEPEGEPDDEREDSQIGELAIEEDLALTALAANNEDDITSTIEGSTEEQNGVPENEETTDFTPAVFVQDSSVPLPEDNPETVA